MRNKVMVLAVLAGIMLIAPQFVKADDARVMQRDAVLTIPLGSATGTAVIQSVHGSIKAASCFVPTLDDTDTATMTLQLSDTDGNLWTPNGWVDKGVAADADNAVSVAAPTADIYASGSVTVGVTASTTQTAARVCRFTIILDAPKGLSGR